MSTLSTRSCSITDEEHAPADPGASPSEPSASLHFSARSPRLSSAPGPDGEAHPIAPLQTPDFSAIVDAILNAADSHYRLNNLAAARDFLSLLDCCQAHTQETLQSLGNICFLLGDFEPAKTAFRRALDRTPEVAALWVGLALTSFRLQDEQGFEQNLQRALTLEPENLDALKLLGEKRLSERRYRDAALTFGKLINRHPEQVAVFLSLAKCFHELGDSASSRAALGRVLELDPGNLAARENLASLGVNVPARDSSCAQAGSPSQLPPLAQQLLARANEAYANGALADAAAALQKALSCAPGEVTLLVCLANIQFQLEQYPQALESYGAAQVLQPESADILVRLAATALRCSDISRFEQALARALELEPDNGPGTRLLADLNFQNGRFEDALQQYRRLLRQAPADAGLLLIAGRCEAELGRWDNAQQAFQQALDADPSSEIARENLKVAQDKLDFQAAQHFRDTAKINWSEISAKLAKLRLPKQNPT